MEGRNRGFPGPLKCKVCLLSLIARKCLVAIEVSPFICVNFDVFFAAWVVLYDGT